MKRPPQTASKFLGFGMSSVNSTAPWYVGGNGATNFTRHEAQKFARSILESETYRADIKRRAETGTLAPGIEAMLWHYAYGKPIEQVNLSISAGQEDLSTLSIVELQERAKDLLLKLEEAEALENAIDVTNVIPFSPTP